MTTKEFIKATENGTAQVLTVAKAQELKGKRIEWMYFGDSANYNEVFSMVVGDICTEYDFYAKTDPARIERLARLEERFMEEAKNTLLLLDEEGNNNNIRQYKLFDCFKEPTFTCSDADREVYFIVCE